MKVRKMVEKSTEKSAISETRRRIEIRKWFLDAEITQQQIAKEAGVSQTLVTLVIGGRRRNEAVLEALRKHGFPMELLEKERGAL